MLNELLRTVLALGLLGAPIFAQQGSGKDFSISGWGGYPISDELTSMWLGEPSGRPLLMVYFEGPSGWHKTEWKMNSKFEKEKPGVLDLPRSRDEPSSVILLREHPELIEKAKKAASNATGA